MTSISVVLSRTALTLDPLTISQDFTGTTYWLPNGDLEWPRFTKRKEHAPPSRYLSGRTLLSRVDDTATLPLVIYATAGTSSALDTAKTALEAALNQWTYSLTLTVDGVARTYTAECADDDISWGAIDSGMVRAKLARGSVVIPLYP